jgi:Mg2+/Co2+ transporter CorB
MVNDDSSIINKLEALLTDDARVAIYNRHMFIVQATDDANTINGIVLERFLPT